MIPYQTNLQVLMRIDKEGKPQEPMVPLREEGPLGEVLDFSVFREKFERRKTARRQAQRYCLMFLQVMEAMIRDYDQQMLSVAKQINPQDWASEFDRAPLEKIRDDVRLLKNLAQVFRIAVEEKGAATFGEAIQTLNHFAHPEVRSTLESFLASDYFGFEAVRFLMGAVVLQEGHCLIDFRTIAKIRRRFQQEGFLHCTYRLAHLDWDGN